eukprot:4377044-Pyramimonas_sp.AAC.2
MGREAEEQCGCTFCSGGQAEDLLGALVALGALQRTTAASFRMACNDCPVGCHSRRPRRPPRPAIVVVLALEVDVSTFGVRRVVVLGDIALQLRRVIRGAMVFDGGAHDMHE